MPAFELLSPKLRPLLAPEGLAAPTEAQEAAIPAIAAGRSVLLIAPTGSGKTEAALLPVLDRLAAGTRLGIRCLYVTPLRALNRDMHRRLAAWAEKLELRVEVRHGDTPQSQRRRQSAKPPDILVTTPETLQAILPAKRMRAHLRSVRWVIVDEVHQLAKDRRGIQLTLALERLREVAGDFQRIGLSATVGNPRQVAAMFGGPEPLEVVHAAPPKRMDYTVEWPKPNDGDFELSRELFISPEIASALTLVRDSVEAHRASLVFVNSRLNAELLGSRLPMVMEGVGVHHGSLPRDARERAEHDLKAGRLKALVCTSTLELGIDVGSVDHALQYQSPRQVAALVQRVGRAGHDLKRTSKGTIVVLGADDVLESLAVVRLARRAALEALPVHEGALDVLAHQIVGLALDEEGRATRARLHKVLLRAWPYRASEGAVEKVGDYLAHLRLLRKEGTTYHVTSKGRRFYFENLSTIRDERTYPVVDLTTMKPVGILGEEEMLLRARKGYRFVVRGRSWIIVQIGPDGTVYVNPFDDPTARIPGWAGEILPVPWEVAQEAGRVRADAARRLAAGAGVEEAVEALGREWEANRSAVRRTVEVLAAHLATGAPFPDERTLVLEGFDHFLVLHSPFGELVNETVADIMEEVLARKNLVRHWWADAYRCLVELTVDAKDLDLPALAREMLVHTEAGAEELLRIYQDEHLPLGLHIKGVAEAFGALPKGTFMFADDLPSLEVRFANTPVEEEAFREALLLRTDIPRTREAYRRIRDGELEVKVWLGDKPSPLAYPIVRRNVEVPEALSPEADREESVQRMRMFLQTERVSLLCFGCARMEHGAQVGTLPERPACPQCASPVQGVLSWHGLPVQQLLQRHLGGETLADEEAKELVRTRQGADLVAVYGKKAVLALSVYGVGPQAAAKVLAKMHRDEGAFFRDLYEAKLRYVLTRPFWDRGQGMGRREPIGKPHAYSPREGASTERRV